MKKYILIISIVLLSLTMLFGNNTAKEKISLEEAFSRGLNYFEGNIVEQDFEKAADWFALGADIWDGESMLYLALSLLNIDEELHLEDAFYWMSLAHYFGTEDAEALWYEIKELLPWKTVDALLLEVDQDLLIGGYMIGDWDY